MEFSLTTLGSASAKPMVDRYSSVHVLNARGRLFLIDCCEGAQFQLVRYKISPMKIDRILISHLHGDHVFGIFGLLSTMALLGRTAELHIYAPRDFSSMLNFYMGHFGEGIKISHNPPSAHLQGEAGHLRDPDRGGFGFPAQPRHRDLRFPFP